LLCYIAFWLQDVIVIMMVMMMMTTMMMMMTMVVIMMMMVMMMMMMMTIMTMPMLQVLGNLIELSTPVLGRWVSEATKASRDGSYMVRQVTARSSHTHYADSLGDHADYA
jgi:cytosine/uracil/thiamine/allantoin permease